MIRLELDLSGIDFDHVPQNFEEIVNSTVRDTLAATHSKWQSMAQQRLKTTLVDYLMGLNSDESVQYPYNGNYNEGLITLVGKVAVALESGWQPFDMRKGFENSPKTHKSKDGGWYARVPFRHRTPGTSGVAVGGSEMPADIYSQASKLNPGEALFGTEDDHPAGVSWTGYHHKNGLYEGMTRTVKQYDAAAQGQYYTFRTISSKSEPTAWWHPGYKGAHVLDQLVPFAQDTMNKIFSAKMGV